MMSPSIQILVFLLVVLSPSSLAFISPPGLHRQIQAFPHMSATFVSKDTKELQIQNTQLFQSSLETFPLPEINPVKAKITKAGMIAFVASMCVALPVTLFPIKVLHKAKIISRQQKEKVSLRTGQFCSRWLLRVIPFAKIEVMAEEQKGEAEPSIWVCNHTSMLDIFFLLATDKKLRGKNKRPIKIIYWKDLEKNPVTGLLFKMCGFLPVEMEDNGNGNTNQYKRSSFKSLLKGVKAAFAEGWDIGILPEGQLNPCPEDGLQPVFGGAFTMAKMSKRPIRMLGLHGLHKLWHGDEDVGMTVTGRKVKVRAYPFGRKFENADEFVESFKSVVGYFGAKGCDNPDWQKWMNGDAWKEMMSNESKLSKIPKNGMS